MSTFNSGETTSLEDQIKDVQSHYRTASAALAGAQRRGSKADVRELTRARKRISAKLDSLKSQLPSKYSAY